MIVQRGTPTPKSPVPQTKTAPEEASLKEESANPDSFQKSFMDSLASDSHEDLEVIATDSGVIIKKKPESENNGLTINLKKGTAIRAGASVGGGAAGLGLAALIGLTGPIGWGIAGVAGLGAGYAGSSETVKNYVGKKLGLIETKSASLEPPKVSSEQEAIWTQELKAKGLSGDELFKALAIKSASAEQLNSFAQELIGDGKWEHKRKSALISGVSQFLEGVVEHRIEGQTDKDMINAIISEAKDFPSKRTAVGALYHIATSIGDLAEDSSLLSDPDYYLSEHAYPSLLKGRMMGSDYTKRYGSVRLAHLGAERLLEEPGLSAWTKFALKNRIEASSDNSGWDQSMENWQESLAIIREMKSQRSSDS